MKLNREITEKFFNCTSKEELAGIIEWASVNGIDLITASRISIDEVLKKFFKKRCTGLKEHAVKMLVGAVNGEDVPDISTVPVLEIPKAVTFEKYAEISKMTPEERSSKIRDRVTTMVNEKSDHFVRGFKLFRDSELKLLSLNENDLKTLFCDHPTVVIGLDSSKKIYAMKRDPATMKELHDKYGDSYFE